MDCKPKHKTLRAMNGFGMTGYDPYSFNAMQNAQNNAATRFANSSYDWALDDRNRAQQNNLFDQGLKTNQFGLQRDQQKFNQGLQRDQFGLQSRNQDFSHGIANRQFDASRTDTAFNQGMQNKQFAASREDKALDNQYRAQRELRAAQDFNRAQAAMSRPRPAMTPYSFGLRNGGEIHAAMGFAPGGFAERASNVKWLSPVDRQMFEVRAQQADDAHALAQAKAAATMPREPMPGEEARAAQQALNTYNQDMAERQQKLQWAAEDRATAKANQNQLLTPYAAQDRARLESRRTMYDNALRGHTGAGGFGLPQRGFGLRNGGDLQTGHGGRVPGTGKGDKIPAKYEPGEFVASNDMLAADPSLLPHLRELRKAVLAQKGMTPEEADAKAIHVEGGVEEPKDGKKGFGIRARIGGEYLPIDIQRARDAVDMTPEDAMRMRLNDEARNARGAAMRAKEPVVPPEDAAEAAYQRSRVERGAQESKARLENLYEPPAKPASPEYKTGAYGVPGAEDVPKQPVAPTQNVDKANASTQPAATQATKDTAPVLQGATGENVGFGITRFNVPGQSPLFTNMTDAAGMASNNALLNRNPQSDQDRIAGDNLANRFAQRQGAEDRMAQRQAELQAEYQQGMVDNRAIASSERQRELLNEQRNLERKIPNKDEAPGVNARIAALETARLGEGSGFGARENTLALEQARGSSTLDVNQANNQARLQERAMQLAQSAPGEQLKNQHTQQQIAQGNTLAKAQQAYADAVSSGDAKAIELTGRQLSALTGKNANGEWKALPGARYTDENGVQHVTNPMMYHSGDGREKQIGGQGGGQSNAPITKAEYDKLPKGARYTAPDGRTLIKG